MVLLLQKLMIKLHKLHCCVVISYIICPCSALNFFESRNKYVIFHWNMVMSVRDRAVKKSRTVNKVCHNCSRFQEELRFLETFLKVFIFKWMHKTVEDIGYRLKSHSFPLFYFICSTVISNMFVCFPKLNAFGEHIWR